ncbi:MAG: DNA repair protein RecO [candidate division WOR-3 bacterium]
MTKAKGIVIGSKRFGESSDVIRFISEELGLASFAALGRRRLRSRMRAALEPLSYSEVILHERRGDVWLAREATLLRDFRGIIRNLEAFELAARLFRLLNKALPPMEPVDGLVPLLLDFLSVLELGKNPKAVYCLALVRIAELFGVGPNLSRCSCGEDNPIGFSMESGVICENCEKKIKSLRLSAQSLATLVRLESAGWQTTDQLLIDDEVLSTLETYVAQHL